MFNKNSTTLEKTPVQTAVSTTAIKAEEQQPSFKGKEKRLFDRIVYQKRLPTISIGDDCFSIRDLSVISLRFANTYSVPVPPVLQATVHLLCGEDVKITGMIYRKLQYDMVMMMKKGIPVELLEKERSYVKKMTERANQKTE